MRHCYDTSILIGILRDDSKALDLVCSHEDAEQSRSTTAITSFELGLGARGVTDRNTVAHLIETMEGLDLDMSAAFIAGQIQNELVAAGRTASMRDLLIGVIARESGRTLHTFDRSFPELDGLDLEIH